MTSNPDQLSEIENCAVWCREAGITAYDKRVRREQLARLVSAAARVEGEGSSRGLGQQPSADAQERSLPTGSAIAIIAREIRRWRVVAVPDGFRIACDDEFSDATYAPAEAGLATEIMSIRAAYSIRRALGDGAARATSDEPSKYSGTSPDTSLPIPQGPACFECGGYEFVDRVCVACNRDMFVTVTASPQPSKGESIDE